MIALGHLVTALLLGIEAALIFMEYRYIGFPDGHLTDLDRVHRMTYPAFAVATALLAAFALWSAWKRHRLRGVIALAVALNLLALAIERYCAMKYPVQY